MRDRSLTLLFLRFREQGDGPALAAVFDACGKTLLELACHLVRDPSEAEDLVQTTFLAAIRRAERFDETQPLQAWLYGILWREAARARRRAARRPDPERLVGRTQADPLELAAAGEVPEAVAQALARMPRPTREVLEPLLFEQKRPEHIARDLARSPGTVRSQIHRGIEELRRALAPRFATYGTFAFSVRGLAQVRASVLKAAGFSPATVATAPVVTLGLLAGSLLMSKSVLVGITAATVLLSGAWFVLEGRSSEAGRGPGVRTVADGPRLPGGALAAQAGAVEPTRPAASPGADSKRAESSPPEVDPERAFDDSVQRWLARFAEAPDDWRHGWSVCEEIAALPPDEALAILRAVWPHLTVPVKEQALKPFVFEGGHPHALPILHLAATDASASVQARAFVYLKSYAFQDFALDYEAYLAWSARNVERPVADVLRDSARAFVGDCLALAPSELAQRMLALGTLDLGAGAKLGLDLAAEMRATGGERLLETALMDPEPDVVRRALEWSKVLRVDERWLRTWILPALEQDGTRAIGGYLEALGRPDCAWAREPVLACLARATKEGSTGAKAAARTLAAMRDPAAIPAMISILLQNESAELAYDVGYFGLAELTGVRWQESYDGRWWADWWGKNRGRFPAEVAALELSR